jgi:Fe-S cluster assembly protein SufD
MMNSPLLTRIAAEHAAAFAADATPAGVHAHRRKALESLLARGLPTGRDENWRYANLRALEKADFRPGRAAPDAVPGLPASIEGFTRFVFVDGRFAPQLSAHPGAGGAATLTRLLGGLPTSEQPFALLNEAFATDGADIRVEADAGCADIEVLFQEGPSPAAAYPRLNVRLAPNARLRLIERHVGSGAAPRFTSSAVRVELAAGADCSHYRLQETGAASTWTDTVRARVHQDARYRLHLLQLGALAARSTIDIELAGTAAQTRIDAVSLADGQQVHDAMIVVDHQAAHTRTVENFRGIAGGRARIAFNGMITVRETAHHADSAQSLKGLIAGSDAEIDLRPQLQIHTDEVRCSHGATTGKLDENMLFYLLSRGIGPEIAQRLLKWAFITDVVADMDVPALRTQVQRSLASHMQDAGSLEGLLS